MTQFVNVNILSISKKSNRFPSFLFFLIKQFIVSFFTYFKAEDRYILRILIFVITIGYYNNLLKEYSILFEQMYKKIFLNIQLLVT